MSVRRIHIIGTALIIIACVLSGIAEAFAPPSQHNHLIPSSRRSFLLTTNNNNNYNRQYYYHHQKLDTVLRMAGGGGGTGGGGGKKKKKRRRRRKQPPVGAVAPDPIKTSLERIEGEAIIVDDDDIVDDEIIEEMMAVGEEELDSAISDEDMIQIADVAKFEFKPDPATMGIEDDITTAAAAASSSSSSSDGGGGDSSVSGAIPLPDIRDAKRKKQMEEELQRIEEEKETTQVKIKRSDKEAFTRLLEQQPFADADDTYFEKEEYGTVSAILGEGAAPFLGIPTGPLQVAHFIGALVIVLMAFVEYPGFPLTNLPTPLRGGLQGGLLAVYAINTVLAVLATFKAGERGQPNLLWAAKTFSVGGLAYDQLTQLPTLEEIERRKSVKGKRALKNKKR